MGNNTLSQPLNMFSADYYVHQNRIKSSIMPSVAGSDFVNNNNNHHEAILRAFAAKNNSITIQFCMSPFSLAGLLIFSLHISALLQNLLQLEFCFVTVILLNIHWFLQLEITCSLILMVFWKARTNIFYRCMASLNLYG